MSTASLCAHPGSAQWALTPEQFRSPKQVAWVFNVYRVCLAGLLFVLFHLNSRFPALGGLNSELFYVALWFYIGISLTALLTTRFQPQRFRARISIQVILDIIMLTLLMYCSSMRSGFGILINAAIAGGGLLVGGRLVYLFASLASFAVLVEQIINHYASLNQASMLSESGFLTATFFATALITYELSNRAQASVDLATQQQDAIAQLATLNSQIISRLPVGAMVIATQGDILLTNQRCQHIFSKIPTAGQSLAHFDAPLLQGYQRWQACGRRSYFTVTLTANNHDYDCRFEQLSNEASANTLILIEDKARTLQQAQQLKLASLGQFSASIAHEIRNPVGAISHAVQLLQESSVSADDEKLLGIIHKQNQRINAVIENVLQLSRRQQNAPRWLPVVDYLNDFIQNAHFAEHTCAHICIDKPENLTHALAIYADASQLTQILMNLCSNGLRYSLSGTGRPTLTCRVVYRPNDRCVVLDIIDQGAGVSEQAISRLFEPFFTTERQGTGLGLYLVKELCELNGIDVQYVATEQGGCFRLTFFQSKVDYD